METLDLPSIRHEYLCWHSITALKNREIVMRDHHHVTISDVDPGPSPTISISRSMSF